MSKASRPQKPNQRGRAVALTGASGKLGHALLQRLLADRSFSAVVVFDLQAPPLGHAKLRFQPLDLTSTSADRVVTEALAAHKVEALAHLPVLTSPDDPAYAHEVEAIGTMRVLAGAAQAGLQRLVMVSTTAVYGALPANPNHLGEDRPLHGVPGSRYLSDKVEMERQVHAFRAAHAELAVTVLRFPPVIGAEAYDPLSIYLTRRFAPRVLGYDPLMQLAHVDDAVDAIAACLAEPHPGDFNVASRGVLPLSATLRLAGVRALPLPTLGARTALRLLNALGVTQTPPALFDFIRYLCVADTRRAEAAGLAGTRTIHQALATLAEARGGAALSEAELAAGGV